MEALCHCKSEDTIVTLHVLFFGGFKGRNKVVGFGSPHRQQQDSCRPAMLGLDAPLEEYSGSGHARRVFFFTATTTPQGSSAASLRLSAQGDERCW